MKTLVHALLVLACSCAALGARTTAVPSDSSPAYLPLPSHPLCRPEADPSYLRERILIRFRLDREGIPHDVAAAGPQPSALADRLAAEVSHWRFPPCRDAHGDVVERDVVLPVDLADRP